LLRSSWASLNTGRSWLPRKASTRPAPMAATRAMGSRISRFGDTGLGVTRGGSMSRKSATPDATSSSPDITADCRRDTRSS
jgi:hypothetical protein